MIDTISLRLPLAEGDFKNDEHFNPLPLSQLFRAPTSHTTLRFNPGKTLAGNTVYTPTYYGEKFIIQGTINYHLRIELSLPKFLYGNNVDELTTGESTLDMIVSKLQSAIANDLGIKYPKEDILSADVTKLHVGKNFMFDDPGAPIFMIETISKTRADRTYDNNNTKYENLGSSFRLHSNTKDIIFYDKKEILRSP